MEDVVALELGQQAAFAEGARELRVPHPVAGVHLVGLVAPVCVGHKGGGQLERQRQVDDGAEAIIEVGGVDGGKVGSVARNVTIACVCQQRELRMLRGVPVGLALPIGAEAPDDACRMRLPHLRGEVHAGTSKHFVSICKSKGTL